MQHHGIQHNDTEYKNIQQQDTKHMTFRITTLSIKNQHIDTQQNNIQHYKMQQSA